ncbi:PEP-CTERM sorting domain-containing protein [Paracoccaceae bacterium GXU_MW_L88]
MKHMNKFAAGAAAAVALSVAAQASAAVYATNVEAVDLGYVTDATRTDANNALGAPDDKFLSLGVAKNGMANGAVVLSFDNQMFDTGTVYEVTFNCNDVGADGCADYSEHANVYFGNDPFEWDGTAGTLGDYLANNFSLAGVVGNADAQGGVSVTRIDGPFKYIGIVNNTIGGDAYFGPNADGFDVNAVSISPVPVPAALPLLGLGILGLGMVSRRRRDA